MSDLIATIFHITDMHLFVDESGALRKDALGSARLLTTIARKTPVPSTQAFFSGAMWHNEEALLALRETLLELMERSADEDDDSYDAPVIVVQGGDVEALGSAAPPDVKEYTAFPSWSFLHKDLRRALDRWSWWDIYGNHDTWPGSYPMMRWRDRAINRARIASIPGLEDPWPDVLEVSGSSTGIPVVLIRLNTVSRTLLMETLASGRVSDHPPAGASVDEVLENLARELEPWRDRQAVRIVSMHHPVHVSGAGGWKFTTGWLKGREELAERLSDLRVQLVLAGHTHKLDPARAATDAQTGEQPPLAWPTAQLVAESPTQDSVDELHGTGRYAGLQRRSFSRYRLLAEGGSLEVERTVFSYSDTRGRFAPAGSTRVFRGLPLE